MPTAPPSSRSSMGWWVVVGGENANWGCYVIGDLAIFIGVIPYWRYSFFPITNTAKLLTRKDHHFWVLKLE